jgi:hypothetical protein
VYEAGAEPGAGTYACTGCEAHVSLEELDNLPDCPRCGGASFKRASMFDPTPEPGSATVEFPSTGPPGEVSWLAEAREEITEAGRYLVLRDETIQTFRLELGWTRIGRSAVADVRLDDPTVSRRHALIVWEEGEDLRVLDDRSLNGVILNGELVEWGTLGDGDELSIGRYDLYLLEA